MLYVSTASPFILWNNLFFCWNCTLQPQPFILIFPLLSWLYLRGCIHSSVCYIWHFPLSCLYVSPFTRTRSTPEAISCYGFEHHYFQISSAYTPQWKEYSCMSYFIHSLFTQIEPVSFLSSALNSVCRFPDGDSQAAFTVLSLCQPILPSCHSSWAF